MGDDAVCGADPELFELIGLAPGPGDELVQAPGVEPRVGVRLSAQRAPAGLSVPKTCATWADALRGAVGAVA